jgi:uncharacterized integral membrane protein
MAREKNTNRADARRRVRAVARESRYVDEASLDEMSETAEAAPERASASAGSVLGFRIPNVREDIAQTPDMFRAKRLLWLPFILLLASFAIAAFVPVNALEPGTGAIISFFVQWFFIPTGLATYLVAGFLAPRAAYLVGFLVGILNAILLVIFAAIRSEEVLASSDPNQAQTGLALLIGYSLVIGPIAAAFASWYRGFLNRMSANSRMRQAERESAAKRKARDEKRAAKRPA